MTVLADPDSGHISGVILGAETKILPYSEFLYGGVQNVLGCMDCRENGTTTIAMTILRTYSGKLFEDVVGGVSETDRHAIHAAKALGLFL